jgi:hypothetical protein
MQTLLGDLSSVLIYLDDILFASKDPVEHMQHLKIVFKRLGENKLFASKSKIQLFKRRVEFLGYLVTPEGIATSPSKIETICKWPILKSQKQLQSLLGAFGYFRKFIPNYAQIALPLTALTKKDVDFRWTPECTQALEKLKREMTSSTVLRPFDPHIGDLLGNICIRLCHWRCLRTST